MEAGACASASAAGNATAKATTMPTIRRSIILPPRDTAPAATILPPARAPLPRRAPRAADQRLPLPFGAPPLGRVGLGPGLTGVRLAADLATGRAAGLDGF